MKKTPLEKAIEIMGSKRQLAIKLGVTAPMVHKMVQQNRVPAEHCKRIEALTGGKVTAERLRPDVFLLPKV